MPLARFLGHVEELRKNAGNIGATSRVAAPTAAPAVVAVEGEPATVLAATRGALVGIVTFVIVTLFLLAGGPPMLARMTAAFVDDFT